jgi:glycosyltransferase involved in cell wall biosynthesis
MTVDRTDGLRVCVFTTAHDATSDRVVQREAASLEAAGHDVTYYTPYERGPDDSDGDDRVDVVSYDHVESGSLLSLPDRVRMAGRVARVLRNTDYDVYHFHDVEALPVGVYLGRHADAATVYDVHEHVPDTLRHKPIFPKPVRPLVAGVASVLERTLARFVDGLVAASPDIARRFADHDGLTIVTNYPRRRWAEETDPDVATRSSDREPVRFVYRGLLSEGRGVYTLMDAIERVPDRHDVRLVLGGRFASEAVETAVQQRVEASDRVEFVEWFPSLSGMIDHFRSADVGLVCFHPDPNKTNAVHRSNKLFQYMAAALPVVVSDIGNWATLVDEEDCGLTVDPEDPQAIADRMVELLENPDERARLGKNGHAAALREYNWERQRERLLALYDRLGSERTLRKRETATANDLGRPTED